MGADSAHAARLSISAMDEAGCWRTDGGVGWGMIEICNLIETFICQAFSSRHATSSGGVREGRLPTAQGGGEVGAPPQSLQLMRARGGLHTKYLAHFFCCV
jgi:hypothetical protein